MASTRRTAEASHCPTRDLRCGRGFPPRSPHPERDPADEARYRRMTETHAECHWHEREREHRYRLRERRRHEPDRAATQAQQKRRLVVEALDDRPNEPSLDHSAEESEAGEEIAGPCGVEPEPARDEEREGRLERRERKPVDEVDRQDAAHQRALQQRRQVAEGIADARARAMD